jgi:hypothetical protein
MAKNKRKKTKKYSEPDEVYRFGPIGIARFGKFTMMRNLATEEEHKKFIDRAAQRYPEVCADFDKRITRIRDLVKTFDPLRLLQCGFLNYFHSLDKNKSTIKTDQDSSMAMRMIDYIQSIIVSTPPDRLRKGDFDQKIWHELFLEVQKFYHEQLTFHIYHTAYLKKTQKDYDQEYDSYYVKAQMLWANVRGDRYMYYHITHLRDLLAVHNDIFEEIFGISIDKFIEGIELVQKSISEGIPKVAKEFDRFREVSTKEVSEMLHSGADTGKSLPELMKEVVQKNNWQEWQDSILGRLFEFDLFDVQKIADFPVSLLRELSWAPGQNEDFFAPGEYAGWPLRVMPVRVCPFICVDGRYYCFELLNLMDNLYRVLQRVIIRLRPDYKEKWNERQKQISEEIPFKLLTKLLPNATTYRSVYHQWATGKHGELNWCETDGLIIFDDHLLIVEIKAGAFTHSPPATDFPAYMSSIKELVLKPAIQAKRFMAYLKSKDAVVLYDDDHKPIVKLRHSQFRHITACCVTLDQFTTLAAQAESLKPIGIDLQGFPIWPISADDLRVYADIFDSPIIFAHFLEERQRAFRSPALKVTDELDHLCLYMKHNRYVSYAEDFYESEAPRWVGYRDDLDKYFHDLKYSPDKAKKPAQTLPSSLSEIIRLLEMKEKPGRCKIARDLLDMAGDTRNSFDASIKDVLARQKSKGHIIPFSLLSGISVTVFCEQDGIASRDDVWKREYVLATLLRSKDCERLLLNLYFDAENKLIDMDYVYLALSDVHESNMIKIEEKSERQRKQFISAYLKDNLKKEVGRNEICPCGSSRKYKRCCGR